MKISKAAITFLIICIMISNCFNCVYGASGESVSQAQENLIDIMTEYAPELNVILEYDMVETIDLSEGGTIQLNRFFADQNYIGYTIWDSEQQRLLEISAGESAYDDYIDCEDLELLYENGCYVIKNEEGKIFLNEFGEVYGEMTYDNFGISTYGILPDVNPQLQGNSNCIVAAVANVMYYWSEHGYPTLKYNGTYAQTKNKIDSLFKSISGFDDGRAYQNNLVPQVVQQYGSTTGNNISGYVNWSPTTNTVAYEIDYFGPCLVGFAAGSSYSETVGHMTMCCGYYFISSSQFMLALADGWSSSIVYKQWDSNYNDCVIYIHV